MLNISSGKSSCCQVWWIKEVFGGWTFLNSTLNLTTSLHSLIIDCWCENTARPGLELKLRVVSWDIWSWKNSLFDDKFTFYPSSYTADPLVAPFFQNRVSGGTKVSKDTKYSRANLEQMSIKWYPRLLEYFHLLWHCLNKINVEY